MSAKSETRTRLKEPRVELLGDGEGSAEAQELLAGMSQAGPPLNIFRTLAHHPKLMKRWLVFGSHILGKQTLPPREREIAILRIGWLCRAEYEWAQHVVIGRDAGLTDEEIRRIVDGPDASGWTAAEQALLQATDELHDDAFVTDTTWKQLSEHFDRQQLMDLVFTVGQYNLVSMALNTFGVQLDPGLDGFPEDAR